MAVYEITDEEIKKFLEEVIHRTPPFDLQTDDPEVMELLRGKEDFYKGMSVGYTRCVGEVRTVLKKHLKVKEGSDTDEKTEM